MRFLTLLPTWHFQCSVCHNHIQDLPQSCFQYHQMYYELYKAYMLENKDTPVTGSEQIQTIPNKRVNKGHLIDFFIQATFYFIHP